MHFYKPLTMLLFATTVFCTGCSKMRVGNNLLIAHGTIERQGFTTYQYGTHLLKTKDSTYVLKSDVIRLNRFLGKQVTITGKRLHDMPEHGPDLYNVIRIN